MSSGVLTLAALLVPAVLAAAAVRTRTVAVLDVLAAIAVFVVNHARRDDVYEYTPVVNAIVCGFLFALWSTGLAAGRIVRGALAPRTPG